MCCAQADASEERLEEHEEAKAIKEAQLAAKRKLKEEGRGLAPTSKRPTPTQSPPTPATAAPKGPLARWLVPIAQS